MSVSSYNVVGGVSDDFPDGISFNGLASPSGSTFDGYPVYSFTPNNLNLDPGIIFWVPPEPGNSYWCIAYQGEGPSYPLPSYGFLSTGSDIVGTYIPFGYWSDSHANNIVITLAGTLYVIQASAGTNGSVSPSTVMYVSSGSSQTWTASPSTNYQVNQWIDNSVVVQTGGTSYSLTDITIDHTITVSFSLLPTYTITIPTLSNGSVSPGTTTTYSGQSILFTAVAADNYGVNQWILDGNLVQTGGLSYSLTDIIANHTLNVTFSSGPLNWESNESFQIDMPLQYFGIGAGVDFSIVLLLEAEFIVGAGIDYTAFVLGKVVGGVLNTPYVELQLGPIGDSTTLTINAIISGIYEVALNTFNWNGIKLVLGLTCSRNGLMKLYINNVLVDQIDISSYSSVVFSPDVVAINHGGNPYGHPANSAKLYQLRFYNGVALSSTQIASIWNGGVGEYTDETAFGLTTNNGFFVDFQNHSGLWPIASALVNGTWTDGIGCSVNAYGNTTSMGYEQGGLPWNPPASSNGIPSFSQRSLLTTSKLVNNSILMGGLISC